MNARLLREWLVTAGDNVPRLVRLLVPAATVAIALSLTSGTRRGAQADHVAAVHL